MPNRTGRLDFTEEGGTETKSGEHIVTEICLGQSLIFRACVRACVREREREREISINEESVIVCNI